MPVPVFVMMPSIMRVFVNVHATRGFVRVRVVMVVREVDIELHAGDRRFFSARNVQVIAVKLELLEFALQFFGVHTEIKQRGDEHVAGDAAENVEIKDFHFCETSELIWLAAKPAPKPLSMFTTVTPLAQLFSMANNAAMPPKLAP